MKSGILAVTAMVVVLASPSTSADPVGEEAAVLAVVQAFFDTMASRDVAGAGKILHPDGRFLSVRGEGGERHVRVSTFQAYLAMLAEGDEPLLERIWKPEVRIHGPIATVWTRYDFHKGGTFSHCGVDAFYLVKTAEGWKIAGGVYTVEPQGCPESPPGPVREDSESIGAAP